MRWTPQEDKLLLEKCRAQLDQTGEDTIRDWTTIAKSFANRNNKDCRKRWVNVVVGYMKKGAWSGDEDEKLQAAVKQFGTSWQLVSRKVQSRSADQCAKRWQQNIDPEIERRQWTAEENRMLVEAVHERGRKWLEIRQDMFPRRPTNSIKNQYWMLTKDRRSSRSTTTSEASNSTRAPSAAADSGQSTPLRNQEARAAFSARSSITSLGSAHSQPCSRVPSIASPCSTVSLEQVEQGMGDPYSKLNHGLPQVIPESPECLPGMASEYLNMDPGQTDPMDADHDLRGLKNTRYIPTFGSGTAMDLDEYSFINTNTMTTNGHKDLSGLDAALHSPHSLGSAVEMDSMSTWSAGEGYPACLYQASPAAQTVASDSPSVQDLDAPYTAQITISKPSSAVLGEIMNIAMSHGVLVSVKINNR